MLKKKKPAIYNTLPQKYKSEHTHLLKTIKTARGGESRMQANKQSLSLGSHENLLKLTVAQVCDYTETIELHALNYISIKLLKTKTKSTKGHPSSFRSPGWVCRGSPRVSSKIPGRFVRQKEVLRSLQAAKIRLVDGTLV